MHRFFIPDLRIKDRIATLDTHALVHQIRRVLRMRQGDKLSVFTGKESAEYLMEIVEAGPREIQVQLLEKQPNHLDPQRIVHLFQAIPKKPALFDMILQKGTEIGVSHFHPIITARTENRSLSRLERRRAITVEAAEQCGRVRIPQIHSPVTFADAIQMGCRDVINHVSALNLLGYEFAENHTLLDFWPIIEKQDEVSLFIGPEGGFTEDEIGLAERNHVKIFSLGRRILRVETASIAALSLLLLSHVK